MAGAGYKLFQTGDVLTAAQVNTYLNEQTVMVFANAAARTSALTSVLAEGMVSYLQDTNAVEVYNGSAWVGVSGAGDVTEVQAGTGISVASGTGPIPIVTSTVATTFDAKGDLVVGTGADTFAKLTVGGTNGHTLQVDSSTATGLKWAAAAGGVTFAGVSCYNTPNNQSLSNNTYTVITWDSEDFDTDGYHSTSSNTSRITIPSGKGGKYLFNGGIYFDNATGTGFRELALYKNGTKFRAFFADTSGGGSTAYPAPQVNIVVEAIATDYFQLYARQNSGTNITQYFDEGCWFQATYLGA
jgi:hypothetical protein